MPKPICMNTYRAMKEAKAILDQAEGGAIMVWEPDFADLDLLDIIGMVEDEAEDKRTNVEGESEDVTPDTLADEGDLI